MLAPRLAMLCKGTAWSQVRLLDTTKLTDPEQGVQTLLQSLASWDEAAELQTYEKCEKALFRTQQKPDETTMSFVNRLTVAFHELGDTLTLQEIKAFILLKQSSLSSEDKRKVITLSGGTLDSSRIEQAMRTLSTKILTSGNQGKKKVYPANYVEEEVNEVLYTEDDQDEEQMIVALAESGDEDAAFVTEFEDHVLDLIQELPEMAECFSSYTQARQRLRDRAKNRGFWPGRGKGKGGKGGGKKGKGFVPRRSLADRIATSTCRLCGKRGHWKWECPQRGSPTDNQPGTEVSKRLMRLMRLVRWKPTTTWRSPGPCRRRP